MFAKRLLASGLAASVLLASSCIYVNTSETAQGGLIGAGTGAALGAVIGEAATGESGKGALIGLLIGSLVGLTTGHLLEQQRMELTQPIPYARVEQGMYSGPYWPRPSRSYTIVLTDQALFDEGSDLLKPAAAQALDAAAMTLASPRYRPPKRVIVIGHADDYGQIDADRDLSARRAQSAARRLVARGVDPALVYIVGMGSEMKVADSASVAGRARNRRVEIVILPND
ncbi:MAG: putative lipoprotein YiaD precursor [candidate division BRC1 bacterium ADurb.BinA364]|nr:MAG: putative lipoprotein YiaD precursor [candidate division BRC1 bacterium ADurb.BinA364]